MKLSLLFMAGTLLLCGCSKMTESIIDKGTSGKDQNQFISYTIKQGSHYCEGNQYKTVDDDEIKFVVRFDSSAIYRSVKPENQYDINKLFGFSDNNTDHHQFSARFGWRWSDNALRLFAYVYNKGIVDYKEIGSIKIGQDVNCSIRITATHYIFLMNESIIEMPRLSTTTRANGYQLYPYFGGDETAPHEIMIHIRQIH
jgi:hypothetical protein